MLVRLLFPAFLTITGILFWFQNMDLLKQKLPVVLRMPYLEMRPMPPDGPSIQIMLFAAFALGFGLAYLLGAYRRLQSAVRIRRLKKELKTKNSSAIQPVRSSEDVES